MCLSGVSYRVLFYVVERGVEEFWVRLVFRYEGFWGVGV